MTTTNTQKVPVVKRVKAKPAAQATVEQAKRNAVLSAQPEALTPVYRAPDDPVIVKRFPVSKQQADVVTIMTDCPVAYPIFEVKKFGCSLFMGPQQEAAEQCYAQLTYGERELTRMNSAGFKQVIRSALA